MIAEAHLVALPAHAGDDGADAAPRYRPSGGSSCSSDAPGLEGEEAEGGTEKACALVIAHEVPLTRKARRARSRPIDD